MHINREGVERLCDVFSTRQKIEILDVFAQHGEMCFSVLVKKGKDENKAFVNNSSMMGLLNDLLITGELVETKIGTCPYTGKNAQYWNTKEKAFEKVETLKESAAKLLAWMRENRFNVISASDLEKLI